MLVEVIAFTFFWAEAMNGKKQQIGWNIYENLGIGVCVCDQNYIWFDKLLNQIN